MTTVQVQSSQVWNPSTRTRSDNADDDDVRTRMCRLNSLLDSLTSPIDLSFHRSVLPLPLVATTAAAAATQSQSLAQWTWTCECRIDARKKREMIEEKLTDEDLYLLLKKVSKKPNFRHLRLSTDGSPIPSLERILLTAWSPSLETFSITRGLLASPNNLRFLVRALKNHPSLRSVCLYDISLPNNPNHNHQAILDPLLIALASIPNLECVDASIHNSALQDDPDIIEINTSTTATTTRKQPHLLVHPSSLQQLISTPPFLEEVSLWNWHLTDSHVRDGLVPALTATSSSSTTTQQQSLRFLSLRQNPHITSDGWDYFYSHVLEHNYALLHVVADVPCTTPKQQSGQFQLQPNQLDRGLWLAQAQDRPDIWCDCLATFANDLDALYYWMQQANPVVIQATTAGKR